MRILTFNFEYPPLGGGGGVVHELIAQEMATRHRVAVITSAFRDLPAHEVRDGVEIIRVPILGRKTGSASTLPSLLSYPPGAWMAARRLLRSEEFDIIHSHFAVPTGIGSLPPALWAGIPHVLSLHGGDIFDPSKRLSPHRLPLVRSAVNWVMERSDAVVAQSENTRENAYRYYAYRGPISLLPLGIRQPPFPRVSRAEASLPVDRFLAVTVGRLVRRKQIDLLIEALADAACAEVDLVVLGDGPERERLEACARKFGLAERVHFFGHVSETRKWQILAAADLFVSATAHEGFGLVFLEAMAAGLPIVTFNHGGQMDFLGDDVHGHLVAVGDVQGLSAAIARVRGDPDAAARFRENCLRAAPDHDIRVCAQAYESLFEGLIARRGIRAAVGQGT
ncbi:MAG: glycosyltransferase family 1 protein [Gemmatimonadales bacterium]|nr:MAG: glycosyltransferase family 1 protein [Gemmatimonadales bacterium]